MLLTVKNLKVHFRHENEVVKAVDGVDFTLNENEILGLVGESGSGKTITALSIMKLLPKTNSFTSGEILCEGRPAMIFQEPFTSLNPVLRVGEQIDEAVLTLSPSPFPLPFGERIRVRGEAKNQTLKFLEKVKIHDPQRIYSSYPHMLSGGERQRAMIAMAIALNPKLLIADEPTTSLDVTIQAGILELILALKKDLDMSVLFITHDFGIINKVADRVLVMKDGRIVERGRKNDILSSPKEDYTKKLLDAVPRIGTSACKEEKTEGGTIVTVKNLNKSFPVEKGIFRREQRLIQAVRNISLQIKEGKTLGLVGESGSGKTTLGKLIMKLVEPDSGSVVSVETAALIQIVFQDPYNSLDPRMKMQDIVLEGTTIRGMARDEKKKILRDVLFKVHLNYKDRLKYPHQFSGGERQRIAIARALAVNPRVLILDEPVSSLDVIIQSEILNLLKDLQKELSLTYIFISHDLRVVEYMADEVAVMYKGEIVELAGREEIYRAPKHPYTKRLLSSIPSL
ncbi:MAG: ABC transporter ATP-binding protein [Candidatus Omnitrophota bacterium]|nr:MAG: ABC transporter ATP-binding protein [Candidatus Omnitrophota bacterium]